MDFSSEITCVLSLLYVDNFMEESDTAV